MRACALKKPSCTGWFLFKIKALREFKVFKRVQVLPKKTHGKNNNLLLKSSLVGQGSILWIERIPVQTPLSAQPGFGTQPHFKVPGDLLGRIKNQKHRISEAASSTVTQSCPWGNQVAVEKKEPRNVLVYLTMFKHKKFIKREQHVSTIVFWHYFIWWKGSKVAHHLLDFP